MTTIYHWEFSFQAILFDSFMEENNFPSESLPVLL